MDWNVISDESGRCPVCNMKLKEYSIDEIKIILISMVMNIRNKFPVILYEVKWNEESLKNLCCVQNED